MISENPVETTLQATLSGDAESTVPVLDPRTPIEVASSGDGTINDPAGTDTKPPGLRGRSRLA